MRIIARKKHLFFFLALFAAAVCAPARVGAYTPVTQATQEQVEKPYVENEEEIEFQLEDEPEENEKKDTPLTEPSPEKEEILPSDYNHQKDRTQMKAVIEQELLLIKHRQEASTRDFQKRLRVAEFKETKTESRNSKTLPKFTYPVLPGIQPVLTSGQHAASPETSSGR